MLEALWSVEFLSTAQGYGAGVIVLESSRVFGGDSTYFYIGSYELTHDILTAEVKPSQPRSREILVMHAERGGWKKCDIKGDVFQSAKDKFPGLRSGTGIALSIRLLGHGWPISIEGYSIGD